MASPLEELLVALGIDASGYHRGLGDAERRTQSFVGNVQTGIGQGLGIGLFGAFTDGIGDVIGGLEDAGAMALQKAGEMERFDVQLRVLLGSTEAAKDRLEELTDFAASTPFELPQVIEASRTLQVFSQGVLATGEGLRMVGDIASGVGRPFNEVAMWVGRMYDAMQSGRPFGEATMRLQEMGAMSGDSRRRIEALAAAVKDGSLTMEAAWDLAGGEFAQFAGLMEGQSFTLEGQLSNLQDSIGMALAGIGDELMPIAKQVVPALTSAIKGFGQDVAGFLHDRATDIARFGATIAGYIVGIARGLGSFFGMFADESRTYSDAILDARERSAALADSTTDVVEAARDMPPAFTAAAGGADALTGALRRQIDAIGEQIDGVNELDAAQDRAFSRSMRAYSRELEAQLGMLDAQEEARRRQRRDAELAANIAEAQAAAAVGDPDAIASANERLQDLLGQQEENRHTDAVAIRRDELRDMGDQIDAIVEHEREATDKRTALNEAKAAAQTLASQIAAAQEAGDLEQVADLHMLLEARKSEIARLAQEVRNADRLSDLETEKGQLDERVKAVSGANKAIGASFGDLWSGIDTSFNTPVAGMFDDIKGNFSDFEQNLEDAKVKGEEMGVAIATAVATIVEAIVGEGGLIDQLKAVIGFLGTIVDLTGRAGLGLQYLTDPALQEKVKQGGGIPVVSGLLDLLGGVGDVVQNLVGTGDRFGGLFPGIEGRAHGGGVAKNEPYWVGERGVPELFVPDAAGRVLAETGPGGSGFAGSPINLTVTVEGAAIFDPYGAAAQQIAEALQPSLGRALARAAA